MRDAQWNLTALLSVTGSVVHVHDDSSVITWNANNNNIQCSQE